MFRLLIAFVFLAVSSISQAVPMYNMTDGRLSSIQNIDINGVSYDVSFQNGSFNSIFGSDTNLVFTSFAEASAASNALLSYLLDGVVASDGFTYNFDTNNSLVSGCVNYIWCDILTPYLEFFDDSGNEKASSATARNFYDVSSDFVLLSATTLASDFDTNNSTVPFWYTYANWSLSNSNAVPEPATVALMVVGLLGMTYARRSR